MKSVLLSIQPEWCELIASGEKTIEVRKTKPKLATPFKCYMYMTKDAKKHYYIDEYFNIRVELIPQKVIGEFVCDDIDEYTAEFVDGDCYEDIRWHFRDIDDEEREVIIWENSNSYDEACFLFRNSKLTREELKRYVGLGFHDKPFYGWYISDLIIYDESRELSEFWSYNEDWHKAYDKQDYVNIPFCAIGHVDGDNWGGCPEETWDGKGIPPCYKCWDEWNGWCHRVEHPPMSWCYVESLPPYTGGERR